MRMVAEKIVNVNTLAYGWSMIKEKLSQKDWVVAGFNALQQGGPQALKIEPIAKSLNVSKGSFYWHFNNAEDLKHSMLDYWVDVATKSIIKAVEDGLVSSDQTLHYLVKISSTNLSDLAPKRKMIDEASIRDWARYDPTVAKVVKNVDEKRLRFVAVGFERAGFTPALSKRNAKTLYGALIGLDYLANHGMAEIKEDLNQVLNVLLHAKSEHST